MNPIHPKVKVPAVVGTIIAIVLAVLTTVSSSVPAAVPYTAIAVTVITAITGYLTYSA